MKNCNSLLQNYLEAKAMYRYDKTAKEIFNNGFPFALKKSVEQVMSKLPIENHTTTHAYSDDFITTYLNGSEVSFPYRIYFSETELTKLSSDEKMIAHCIYSRHHNGYVREKHIKSMLEVDFPMWVIPYLIKAADEYVVEILEIIYNKLKDRDTKEFKAYCLENRQYFGRSYNRMISYWNEFYRKQHPAFKNYVGRKLFIECFGARKNMTNPSQGKKSTN